jgi:hypothetical protein
MHSDQPPAIPPRSTGAVATALLAWLIAAVGLGATGTLAELPRPTLQGIIAALTVAVVVAHRLSFALRQWFARLDSRWILLLHTSRLGIGAAFLILEQRGTLPRAFALPAGWGDIVVGAWALALTVLSSRRRILMAWNLVGLIDILAVVANAGHLGLAKPEAMKPLAVLPLCLLPTFLVPLIIATHIGLGLRLLAARGR